MKRTQLKRSQKRLLRYSTLRAMSQRGVSFALELEEMKPMVIARAGHICERCGAAPIEHIHHKLRRSQGGTNMMTNLLAVCARCHRLIHENPGQSYDEGTLIRRKDVN